MIQKSRHCQQWQHVISHHCTMLILILTPALVACGAIPDHTAAILSTPTPGMPTVPPPEPALSDDLGHTRSQPTDALMSTTPTPTLESMLPTPDDADSTPAALLTPEPTRPQPVLDEEGAGSEILFLRQHNLIAYNLNTTAERVIAHDVREFTATTDGRLLAITRPTGPTTQVWLVARNGDELRQVTNNDRHVGHLSWAPDGQTLVYATSTVNTQRPTDWISWVAWCSNSDIRLLDIASGTETILEPGCDPSFARDGQRIAFASPPMNVRLNNGEPGVANSIRLINRRGQNAWNFATATGSDDGSGRLVYAPVWSPDSNYVAYQRFMGYQALVDINYTEMGRSFEGRGQLVGVGAGWLLPSQFAPDGSMLVTVEHNFSDARGFGGYESWRAQVVRLGEPGEVILPEGPRKTIAAMIDRLPRATGAAWAPDSERLVVALPVGWQADLPSDEPVFEHTDSGDLWLWTPGTAPATRIVQTVDFASPLLWLAAPGE